MIDTDRTCARPGCGAPARVTLTFRYATREAWLGPLSPERLPSGYDLCGPHADRTHPPRGWRLTDQRPASEVATASRTGTVPAERADRTREQADGAGVRHDTVALLAAALGRERP